ncbi:uncharacterized protein LOC126184521 isoform X2 [Schistocerca cancellata]|uniref:uncharacterized protein LOC126184521 isoform X2 n=1 Tax=Schistocerca cancellata TaxID=274614 RepID=UPI002118F198|nr:uncharacterized protein LOC126184521 isoform X2 [Schistocerca cancellata]
MARSVISGKSDVVMEGDESEDEIFVGRLQKKELLKLRVAGNKIPTACRYPVVTSVETSYSGSGAINNNELSENIRSTSTVLQNETLLHKCDIKIQKQSSCEDKSQCTTTENLITNCNINEGSVVVGGHLSLQAEVDATVNKCVDENINTNVECVLCDYKLTLTDRSEGSNQTDTVKFEIMTTDVNPTNSLHPDVLENLQLLSDTELSEEITSTSSVHQSKTQLQEFVPGKLEQSLDEDNSQNLFCENLMMNCNVTERCVVGSRHASLQTKYVDTENGRENGHMGTNMTCLMSADRSDGDNQMSADVHSTNSLLPDVSESFELVSDIVLSEEITPASSLQQSETQMQEFVTGRPEKSLDDNKSQESHFEYLMKNWNVTERLVMDSRHTPGRTGTLDIETKRKNGDTDANDGGIICDDKLMSADTSDGENQMSVATFEDRTFDEHLSNSFQPDDVENVELLRNSELSEEITSKSLVHQSKTELQTFIPGRLEQSLDEDNSQNLFCENLMKNCNVTERCVVGSRFASLQTEYVDSENGRESGLMDTNVSGGMLCDEKLMSADRSDGDNQMSADVHSTNSLQQDVSESVELISDTELSEEIISPPSVHQSKTQLQAFVIGRLEQSWDEDNSKTSFSENLTKNCNITESSVMGSRNTSLGTVNVSTETKIANGSMDTNVGGTLCDKKLISTGSSTGENKVSVVTSESVTVDVHSTNTLQPVVSERHELIKNHEQLAEASVLCGTHISLPTGNADITTKKADGNTTTNVVAVLHPKVIISADQSGRADQITAVISENLNLQSSAFSHIKAFESDCDDASIDPECMFRSEVSAIVQDINNLEKYETYSSPASETCVLDSMTSSDVSGVMYCSKEYSSSTDEDIFENTFEMMEKLLNGFEMKPDCACEVEAGIGHAYEIEPDRVAGACDAEPDRVAGARDAEPDRVAGARDAEPDRVAGARDAEPDRVAGARDAEPDRVAGARDAEPDRVAGARDAEPDRVAGARDAEPDRVAGARDAEPDRVAGARDAEPDRVAGARDAEPDRVAGARDAEPDRVADARDAEPDRVAGARDAEPDCARPSELKMNSADNLENVKFDAKSIKSVQRESRCERFLNRRASGNIFYQARCSKTPKRDGSTQKMPKNKILPQSAGSLRKGKLQSVKSCVKEYLNSTQPPLFSNVRNRNGYGIHQKVLRSPMNAKKVSQDCSTPCKSKKIILPPVTYTSSSAAKLDLSKSTSANYVAEKCKRKIVPRSSPTVIKHTGRTVLPTKQWKQNGESEGEVSVLLTSEAVRSNTLKSTRKKK